MVVWVCFVLSITAYFTVNTHSGVNLDEMAFRPMIAKCHSGQKEITVNKGLM